MDHTACLCAPFHPKIIGIDHNQFWNEPTQQAVRLLIWISTHECCVYLYTGPHVIYGNNVTGLSGETFHGICWSIQRFYYNVVTTSRLFFTQLSNILFQVVSEWQTQTCIIWVITWSMEATNEFSPDPLTLWLYFAPWTVWIYVLGTLNKVLHSQTNSEIKDLFRLLVLCQRAVV